MQRPLYALLPMVRNTHTGVTNVDPSILEAAKGMGSTKAQILFKIKLRLLCSDYVGGSQYGDDDNCPCRYCLFYWCRGVGGRDLPGITTNNAAMTMAGSLLIALLALAMDFILGFIEKRIRRHSAKAKRTNKMMAAVAAVLCLGIVGGAIIHIPQKDTIHIATKPMTEQYILGEMLDILIEQDTDLNVELTQGVGGGTSNIQPQWRAGNSTCILSTQARVGMRSSNTTVYIPKIYSVN